ncbi:hypothetical protein B0H16DRAFT_1308257 [Mycena metata]|uniref:Uncharacterized protein n=1 Tax=Mycena metata TaxID=1033252 RepID=A0AAD7JNC3_9AGAR|nr:hypothetical protein B0H16DRAFT_1308257 [Mycena metata]
MRPNLLILSFASLASANTEIQNFGASECTDAPVLRGQDWPTLRPRTTTHWSLTPALLGTPTAEVCPFPSPDDPKLEPHACPHELWLALDFPDMLDASYTLRVSWPASSPTDFHISILDPRAAAALFLVPPAIGAPSTRRKYARIRAVDAGVRTPGDEQVHFILTLEPLVLGVLPTSLLPFLLVSFSVLLLLWVVVLPRVQAGVDWLVVEARRELDLGRSKSE